MKPRQSRGASSAHPEKRSAAFSKGKRGPGGQEMETGTHRWPFLAGTPRESLPTEASSLPSNNKGRRTHASEGAAHPGRGRRLVSCARPTPNSTATLPDSRAGMTKELRPSAEGFQRAGSVPATAVAEKEFRLLGGGRSRRQAPRVHCLPLTGGSLLSSPLFAAPPAQRAGAEEVNRKVRVSPSHSFFSLALSPATATLNSYSPGSDAPARTTHVQRSGKQ